MASFLFALVAVFLCSLGARDQLIVARLSQASGQGVPVLATGVVTSAATAAVMAFAGARIAALLPPSAATMLVAFALAAAAIELAWPVHAPEPAEPTRSLGAIALVLAARQIGDAARFCIFALAAATAIPWLAGVGGALGGIGAVALGWSLAGQIDRRLPLRAIRLTLAVLIGVLAVLLALNARGLIG